MDKKNQVSVQISLILGISTFHTHTFTHLQLQVEKEVVANILSLFLSRLTLQGGLALSMFSTKMCHLKGQVALN